MQLWLFMGYSLTHLDNEFNTTKCKASCRLRKRGRRIWPFHPGLKPSACVSLRQARGHLPYACSFGQPSPSSFIWPTHQPITKLPGYGVLMMPNKEKLTICVYTFSQSIASFIIYLRPSVAAPGKLESFADWPVNSARANRVDAHWPCLTVKHTSSRGRSLM